MINDSSAVNEDTIENHYGQERRPLAIGVEQLDQDLSIMQNAGRNQETIAFDKHMETQKYIAGHLKIFE